MTRARILADYVAGGTTAAEFDYMDGVTSNVQTQLDAKLPLAGGTMTGNIVMGDDTSIGIADDAERIEFDGAGDISVLGANLGVGIDAPLANLHVEEANNGAVSELLRLDNSGSGANTGEQLSFHNSGERGYIQNKYRDATYAYCTDINGSSVVVQTGGTDRMTITSAGNVGIGVGDPDASLEVNGQIRQDWAGGTGNNSLDIHNSHSGGYGPHFRGGGGATANYSLKVSNYASGQHFLINGSGDLTASSSADISDERLKENIATVTDALTKIKALTGRTFTWKAEAKMSSGTKYGLIAQELEKVIPDLVHDASGIRSFDKDDNLLTPEQEQVGLSETDVWAKSVVMSGIIPVLIEAVKELSAKNDALEARIETLENA